MTGRQRLVTFVAIVVSCRRRRRRLARARRQAPGCRESRWRHAHADAARRSRRTSVPNLPHRGRITARSRSSRPTAAAPCTRCLACAAGGPTWRAAAACAWPASAAASRSWRVSSTGRSRSAPSCRWPASRAACRSRRTARWPRPPCSSAATPTPTPTCRPAPQSSISAAGRWLVEDLETFAVYRDGRRIDSPDFNFWGVTFLRDGRHVLRDARHEGADAPGQGQRRPAGRGRRRAGRGVSIHLAGQPRPCLQASSHGNWGGGGVGSLAVRPGSRHAPRPGRATFRGRPGAMAG